MSRKRRRNGQRPKLPNTQVASSPTPKGVTATGTVIDSRAWLFGGALLLFTLAIYSQCFSHSFVHYDDPIYITENAHVLAGLTPSTFVWSLRTFAAGNWHPITWWVHALNVQIFGGAAGGQHFVSALLHGLNTGLLFLLLFSATGARWRSLVVALLFAAHPLNVESVAWAAELKTPLCTLFFLLGLGAYGWYVRRPSAKRYSLLAVFFVLASASKPMAISFPFVLLLLDFWPLDRVEGWSGVRSSTVIAATEKKSVARLLLEKMPLFAVCIFSAIVTVIAQKTTSSVVSLDVSSGNAAPIGISLRLENALQSYAAYLWKAIWPTRLAPFYPFPFASIPAWRLVVAGAVLISISAAAWKYRRERPSLIVGWLFYLGTLVPMIGLLQVGGQAMADRYAYLPMIGIFVLVVWLLADLGASQKWRTPALAVAAGVALLLLTGCSLRQQEYWQGNYSLWAHTLEVSPDNPVAEHNISIDLMQNGHLQEAQSHLLNSVRIDPSDVVSRINLAVTFQDEGHYSEAIDQYKGVLAETSDPKLLPVVYENMGNIYHAVGDFSKSEESYRDALRINPLRMSAIVKLQDLQRDRDISSFARSIASHPSAQGYVQLGRMLRQANWIPEARDAYQKALALDPSLDEARTALAVLPVENGQPKEH